MARAEAGHTLGGFAFGFSGGVGLGGGGFSFGGIGVPILFTVKAMRKKGERKAALRIG